MATWLGQMPHIPLRPSPIGLPFFFFFTNKARQGINGHEYPKRPRKVGNYFEVLRHGYACILSITAAGTTFVLLKEITPEYLTDKPGP